MSQRRSATHRFNLFGVVGLVLAALAGCSGDDGPPGPAGSNAVVGGTTVNVSSLSTSELQELSFSRADSKVTSVTINSAPVVRFTLKDSTGRGVTGLGFWSQSSTSTTRNLTNMAFALAKLVPAPTGSSAPSRWVSYMVTTIPTTTAPTSVATRPSTDGVFAKPGANPGEWVQLLQDHGDGTYTYTFYRDIATVAATVASTAETATNKNADLGDLTYNPNLTHRLTIQIGGAVRGTGSNTENAVTVVPSVPMQNPINIIYDFIPATGQVVSSSDEHRNIVDVSACFQCHGVFTWHGGEPLDGTPGSRQDTKYCVVCHTDQRKYGRADATRVPAGSTNPTGYTGNTYRMNFEGYDAFGTTPAESWGESAGLMVRMVHRIHRGNQLARTGYNFAGVLFNEVTYPQDRRNCRKCHTGTDGDNFKNKPNRAACGACHDYINFTTGENLRVPGSPHSVQLNDNSCATCHTPTAIETKHTTDNATTNNPSVPTGAVNFTYEISSVTVTATTQPVIKFRILNKDTGAPIVFNGTTSGTSGNPLSGFTGAPSFVIAYTMTQDGITTPADYNNLRPGVTSGGQPQTVSIANLTSLDTNWVYAPTTSYGTLSAPDASGYYTATITNAARGFPSGSKMRAAGLQGYFTQSAGTGGIAAATPRHAISVVKGVTGDTQRRAIVDNAKCANCHEWLELHGGNRVYETGVCVMCHNPNLSSSGRGADATLLAFQASNPAGTPNPAPYTGTLSQEAHDAAVATIAAVGSDPLLYPEATNNFKNLVHQIHGSHKRTNAFRHVRDRGTSGIYYYDWSEVTFPGILRNCETCHKALSAGGGYDSVPSGALPTTNVTTDGNGGTTVAQDRASLPNANDDVTLPFLATCISCHDSTQAISHMKGNGAVVTLPVSAMGLSSQLRSAATGAVEQCALCHGPGRIAAVSEVHARR